MPCFLSGVVFKNDDPLGKYRLKVAIAHLGRSFISNWLPLMPQVSAVLDKNKLYSVGDQVVVQFGDFKLTYGFIVGIIATVKPTTFLSRKDYQKQMVSKL